MRGRLRTAELMALLAGAKLLVSFVPLQRWRGRLGSSGANSARSASAKADAKRMAAQVEWAATRLPLKAKCLPRAMVLSWMLRRHDIAHAVVFAVRPAQSRGSDDDLHAWVEIDRDKVIGDLPGPWVETLRIGTSHARAKTPGTKRRRAT